MLSFGVLEIDPLLCHVILKLSHFILVISDNHLALLQIALKVLSLLQKTIPNALLLIRLLLDELQPRKETLSFSHYLLVELIDLELLFFQSEVELPL